MTEAGTSTPAEGPADGVKVGAQVRFVASKPAEPADVPVEAQRVFGAQLADAVAYAHLLATDGTAHGHLGPREVPRLWQRHLLNCAVVADLLPQSARVVDVGSGAGLPGLPLALARPDLSLVLVEPMQRRVTFLEQCVDQLGLADRVSVVRGRAESSAVRATVGTSRWVTARAVAPLERLADWCVPLLEPGGQLLALKGSSVRDEIAAGGPVLSSQRVARIEVVTVGSRYGLEPTTVAIVTRGTDTARRPGVRPPRARDRRPRRQGKP